VPREPDERLLPLPLLEAGLRELPFRPAEPLLADDLDPVEEREAAFRAGDRCADVFLAAVFLAVVFLAVVFFAAAF